MRAILAGVMVLGLAGCGLRYIGTEDQMQQVARGTAELMKQDPNGGMVSGAGTAAHALLSATMGQQSEPEAKPQIIGAFADEARQVRERNAADKASRTKWGMYGPLPADAD